MITVKYGTRRDDFFYNYTSDTFIFMGDGRDTVYESAEPEYVTNNAYWGGSGNDKFMLEGGDDFVKAGKGNDYIVLNGSGDSYIDGGPGYDVLRVFDEDSHFKALNIEKVFFL